MPMKSRMKPSAEFSTSSMADLVFLLLIFFMLTSTFVTQTGVTIELPKSSSDRNNFDSQSAVTISADGTYFWNETELARGKDEAAKQGEAAKKIEVVLTDENEENNTITLRVDKEVKMEKAAFIMGEVAKWGGKVVIATEKD